MLEHVRDLLSRPDFWDNPPRAVWRRYRWRQLWTTPGPHQTRLRNGAVVYAPTQGGMGGLIHYQGCSERDTFDFVTAFLKPGMVFWDIGAHIGEYAILAASMGVETHAFEADPELCALIRRAKNENGLQNLTVVEAAVASQAGEMEFTVCDEPSVSALRSSNGVPDGARTTIRVPTLALDDYARQFRRPDLIKIDVEGAERMVLAGARSMLSLPGVTVILEYTPANCARFGYHPMALLATLESLGFETSWLEKRGALAPTTKAFTGDSINVVARKIGAGERQTATAG